MGRFLIRLIGLYRRNISPFLPPACRFTPSCSNYSMEAISRYGPLRGSWMAFLRILKCHPFHPGGYDPLV
ncbi:MAG: membrane protein insertion efficiency factor YidD [Nitrospirota bacterium]